jgi:multiple sugar transport system permease protein
VWSDSGTSAPASPVSESAMGARTRLHRRRAGRVLTFALLCCLVAVSLFPLLVTITNAFMSSAESAQAYSPPVGVPLRLRLVPEQVVLSQFYEVLVESPRYLLQFWNSVFLVVPIVAGHVIVGSMAAYAFSVLRFRGRDVLFFLYIVTMLMPYQVTLVPNFIVADTLHLVGRRASIILPGIFQTFGVFLLRQFMAFIPDEVVSAGKVDGATHFQIYSRIVLPLSRAGLASLAILLFVDNWNMVEQPVIFLRDQAMMPLSVFLGSVNSGQRGLAFAAATVYMLPMLFLFLYGEQALVQGIQRSGIQG